MKKKVPFKLVVAAVAFVLLLGGQAFAIVLPSPTQLYDGVQVAVPYDDVWSYSAKLVDALQDAGVAGIPAGDFQFPTGTGGLDVILYTGAGGANNQNVGPGGAFDFEDPVDNPGGNVSAFQGWWGQNDQNNNGVPDNVNGPVTVGNVLNYLHALNPNNNIPVFYIDLNQQGAAASLLINGEVYLIDNVTGNRVHTWALDTSPQGGAGGVTAPPLYSDGNLPNASSNGVALTQFPFFPGFGGDGAYDQAAMALAFGQLSWTGTSGTVYDVNHNLGSGSPDFIIYAPSMNLSLYDPNDYFVVHFNLGGLNDGFEEIFLTGTITPFQVPEPATLLLVGAGLVGLAGLGRRRFFKK